MKKIDKRVLDIEKADFNTKFEHDRIFKMNLAERILNTPDEKFNFIMDNFVSLKIDDNIKIDLHRVDYSAMINVYHDDFLIDSFTYKEPFISPYQHELTKKEKQDSDCELLRNKIKSICKIKLEVTPESEKYMSVNTKRYYDVFDAISGDFE